jgi:hypothetical protein
MLAAIVSATCRQGDIRTVSEPTALHLVAGQDPGVGRLHGGAVRKGGSEMAERDKRDEDTEGEVMRRGLGLEGTDEKDAEGQGLKFSVKPEGTEDAEGQRRKSLTPEDTDEEDAEGHDRRP